MRRTVRILTVLALVVAVASVGVMAQRNTPRLPKAQPGETYVKADIWKGVAGEVTQMPIVEGQSGVQSATAPGVSDKASKFDSYGGSAIPGSTFGTAFLTPSEKTGKEIRKVIARLG